jgi:solute carrier family 44 protein 1 (choline transporter-like protein)/choline transporter-like protein 2/4/5
LLPFTTILILLLYFIYWIGIALYLYSSGTLSTLPHQLPFGQYTFTQQQKIYGYYWLFGLFWNAAFIIASVEFIVCGAVCIWYFQ